MTQTLPHLSYPSLVIMARVSQQRHGLRCRIDNVSHVVKRYRETEGANSSLCLPDLNRKQSIYISIRCVALYVIVLLASVVGAAIATYCYNNWQGLPRMRQPKQHQDGEARSNPTAGRGHWDSCRAERDRIRSAFKTMPNLKE
jgi:hypothetical protein